MTEVPCILGGEISIAYSDLVAAKISAKWLRDQVEYSNPEFFKAERMGFWTGNIPRKMTAAHWGENFVDLPRGVWERLRRAFATHGVKLRVGRSRAVQRNVTAFGDDPPLTPGEDQVNAVKALVARRQGIICAPCGGGKTAMALMAMREIGQRTVVEVHTEALMDQWVEEIQRWYPSAKVGVLYGKAKKADDRYDVVVAMQQTLRNWLQRYTRWGEGFGFFVQDEVHHSPATTFLDIPRQFPARWRLGLTATPNRKDGKHPLLYDTFGPILAEITDEDLDKSGRIVPVDVLVTPTDFAFDLDLAQAREAKSFSTKSPGPKAAAEFAQETGYAGPLNGYGDMLDAMGRDRARMQVLFDIAKGEAVAGRTQLILGDRKETLENIRHTLREAGVECARMFGTAAHKKELELAADNLEAGTLPAAVGTTVADEGLNIKRLATLIITNPTATNPGRLTQQIGRAKRLHPTKKEARAWYLWDRRIPQVRAHLHALVKSIKHPHRLWYVVDPTKPQGRIPLDRELAHKLAPKE